MEYEKLITRLRHVYADGDPITEEAADCLEHLFGIAEQLRQRVAELEAQLEKNNPLLDEAADAIDKLTAERDELVEANRIACEDLVERHDRITELAAERDELLAALILASCCLEPNTSSATVNQIESAIASVKEK